MAAFGASQGGMKPQTGKGTNHPTSTPKAVNPAASDVRRGVRANPNPSNSKRPR